VRTGVRRETEGCCGLSVTQAHSAIEHPLPDFVKSNHRLVLRSVGLPKTRSRRILRRFLKAKEAGLEAEMSPPWRLIVREIVSQDV
jgi:hypothetical protein